MTKTYYLWWHFIKKCITCFVKNSRSTFRMRQYGGALLLNILIWVSRPEIFHMVLKFLACVWSNCIPFVFRVLVHKMNFMTSNIMNNGGALISFNFDGFFLCLCFLDLCNISFPSFLFVMASCYWLVPWGFAFSQFLLYNFLIHGPPSDPSFSLETLPSYICLEREDRNLGESAKSLLDT